MMPVKEIHEKIIGIIERKGPSLPMNLAKELKMSSLFVSAFLSELVGEKKIKISHLKVGGSPLYFLIGQESQLENYNKFMHPKESEAFLKLKESKILKDSEQEPAIRVALRLIKDFSVGFRIGDDIYWRHILISEDEAKELIGSREAGFSKPLESQDDKDAEKIKIEEVIGTVLETKLSETGSADNGEKEIFKKSEEKGEKKILKSKEKKTILTKQLKIEKEDKFDNPLVIKELEKPKKEKPKSKFVLGVIDFINRNNLKIVDEKDYKAKEYTCVVQIKSELGPVNFFTQAKNKKNISEEDLKKLLSTAQSIPLPAFILYTGEINRSAKEYLKRYPSILKAKKIE